MKFVYPIEPVICLNIATIAIRELLVNNLLMETACKVNVGYNRTVCESIASGLHRERNLTEANSEIQRRINDALGWCLSANGVIPIVLLLFVGSFSDEHKSRKPFLILPTIGELIATLGCMLCVWFREVLPVEVIGTAHYVVPALFGTVPILYMAAFAYVADASGDKTCIVRLTVLQVSINVCRTIGVVVGGYLFMRVGYGTLMQVCVLLLVAALCYGTFAVEDIKDESKSPPVRNICSYKHVWETLQLLTTSGGVRRTNIVFILGLQFLVVLVLIGEGNVLFWFTQQTYAWTNTDYAYFQGIRSVLNSLALSIAVPVTSKLFSLRDITIVVLSLLDKVISNVICVTVKTSLGVYLATAVGTLTIAASSGIRSLSSTYVSKGDVGKAQSLLSIVEAVATGVATWIYNRGVYYYTHNSYPYTFLHFSSSVCVLSACLCLWKSRNELSDQQDLCNKENSPP
uniref:Major facilitator superfamily associated domain-containing protein n=1 Tax=Photinus pyralis TaxID=7054 RepID=A0A1Y1M0G3_PHOPY